MFLSNNIFRDKGIRTWETVDHIVSIGDLRKGMILFLLYYNSVQLLSLDLTMCK